MATATTRSRIDRTRRVRKRIQQPLGETRRRWAERRELAREAGGVFADLGRLAARPATGGYRRLQTRGETRFGKPVTAREARRHEKAKTDRPKPRPDAPRLQWLPAKPPQPRQPDPPKTNDTPSPRERTASVTSTADVHAAQDSNEAILRQLNNAAGAMSELDLTHAHLFDATTEQLGRSALLIADAIREVSRQVDSIPLARQLVQEYEELADHMAQAQEHARNIRKRFRNEYDPQLNPDKRTPPASFFDGIGS